MTQLIWTLFSLVWVMCGVLTDVSFGMAILGIPLVVSGVYGLIGHALNDLWRRKQLA